MMTDPKQFFAYTAPTPDRGYVGYAQAFMLAQAQTIRLALRQHGETHPKVVEFDLPREQARGLAFAIIAETGGLA